MDSINFRSSRPEVFCKKVFLKISQNSQENTCARVYVSLKLKKFLTFTLRNLFFGTSNSYLEVAIQNDFKKSTINFFYLLCWDQRNLTKKAYYCIDNTHTYTHTHTPTHKMTKQKSQYYPHLFPTNVSPDLANQCRQQQVSLLDC